MNDVMLLSSELGGHNCYTSWGNLGIKELDEGNIFSEFLESSNTRGRTGGRDGKLMSHRL